MSGLAKELGTSRQFLYNLRDKARDCLALGLAARPAGRSPLDTGLHLDQLAETVNTLAA